MGVQTYDFVRVTGLSNSGTTDSTGSWNTSVDLDSFVTIPAGATGVVLCLENTAGSSRWFGVRTTGKTTAAHHATIGPYVGNYIVWVQIGTGNTLDFYAQDATIAYFDIVAVTDSQFVWRDIDSLETLTMSGSYADKTPSVAADTVAVLLTATSDSEWSWRPNGTTSTFQAGNGPLIAQLDGSDIFEARNASSLSLRVMAEIKGGVTFPSWPPTTETPTADSTWRTSARANSGKAAAVVKSTKTSTAIQWAYRKNGSSFTPHNTNTSTWQEHFFTPLSTAGEFDYYVETGGAGDHMVEVWLDSFTSSGPSIIRPATIIKSQRATMSGS